MGCLRSIAPRSVRLREPPVHLHPTCSCTPRDRTEQLLTHIPPRDGMSRPVPGAPAEVRGRLPETAEIPPAAPEVTRRKSPGPPTRVSMGTRRKSPEPPARVPGTGLRNL